MTVEADWGVNRNGYLEIVWRFNPEALEFIEGVGDSITFQPGSRIVAQGEEGSSMYLILDGSVRVVRSGKGGGDIVIAKLERLRSFGEIALLTNTPRSASVVAETEVRVLKISHENLSRLSVENPHIALHIYRILAESLARSLAQTGTIPAQFTSQVDLDG